MHRKFLEYARPMIQKLLEKDTVALRNFVEIHLYITSTQGSLQEIAQTFRFHWGIENNLYWVSDVGFVKDQWLTRLQTATANLSQLQRFSSNLLTLESEFKISISRKRYRCSLNMQFLESVIFNPMSFS